MLEAPPPQAKDLARNKGFTIPEVLISTGILGLVLIACYALVVFAIKWNAKMSDSVETYQQALRAASRISYELGTGAQSSFIYDLDGFAFASARPPDGRFTLESGNKLLWHKYVIFYVEDGVMYRNEVAIDPPTSSLPETPDLPTLKSMLTSKGATMAQNLSELKVQDGSGAIISFKVEGTQEEEDGSKSNSVTLQSRMNFRQ